MLIEDQTLCKKACRTRHLLGKVCAQHLPWKGIGEDSQHETGTFGLAPHRDRLPHKKVLLRGELRLLIQAKEVRCRHVQPA